MVEGKEQDDTRDKEDTDSVATRPSERNARLVRQYLSENGNSYISATSTLRKPSPPKNASFNHLLRHYFDSEAYDAVMAVIISLNVVLIIIETDAIGGNTEVPSWVEITNKGLLGGFSLELMLKMFVYGKGFFCDMWNMIDFTVVGLDLCATCLSLIFDGMQNSGMSMLRILRLVRIGKTMDFLMMFPELGMMLTSLKGTLKSIFWGCMLLAIVIILFGIMAVQIIHPINKQVTARGVYERAGCERCPIAFENVWNSVMTLFQQLIAGDSWGTVCLPIVEESALSFIFFAAAFISLQLLLTNVILAAVVDAASQARESNAELLERRMEKELKENQKALVKLCRQLDNDGNGTLSFEEILRGFQQNREFARLMQSMDIGPEEITAVWSILDSDGSGDVNYEEFANQLYKMKANDIRTMTVFIKYHVQDIRAKMSHQLKTIQESLSKQTVVMKTAFDASARRLPAEPFRKEEKAQQSLDITSKSPKDSVNFLEFREELKVELDDVVKKIEDKLQAIRLVYAEASHQPIASGTFTTVADHDSAINNERDFAFPATHAREPCNMSTLQTNRMSQGNALTLAETRQEFDNVPILEAFDIDI